MILRNFILIFLQSLFLNILIGQKKIDTIHITNGSFDGIPRCCKAPDGWIDCGSKFETPPDIQPVLPPLEPLFGVTMKAYDGKTYLGLVVRENESIESVCQELSMPILKGKCYSFSIYMTRSLEYLSHTSSGTAQLKAFTTPAILRIWGGDTSCDQKELLATSQLVENIEWQRYDFVFMPKSDISYLQLEAYYNPTSPFPYNGNILLDKASDIILVPCKTDR